MRWVSISVVVAVMGTTCLGAADTSQAEGYAVQPQRVLDTRSGLGAPVGRLVPGQTLALPLLTETGPSATSVSLNLTVTDATAAGFLTAWPCGQATPPTSILNYLPGQTVANFAALGLGDGRVCLATSAPVHVVADLMGWFTGTADFVGTAPSRLLDSRVTRDPLKAGVERRLSVAKGSGYPGPSAAVALNVTVVQPGADGFVTVYPCGPRPLASTVNYRAGEIVPSFTVVPYSGSEVCLYAMTDTEIVVDSFGWSSNTAGLKLASPSRLLDTRSGIGWSAGAAGPAQHVRLRVAGRGGVPNDAAAALLTITATGGTAEGFVTAWPCDQPLPLASVLNLRPNLLRSNLALLRLAGSDGTVCLFASTVDGSTVHLVADVVGWVPGSIVRPPPPQDPPPPAGGSGHFSTLPVGAALPTDAQCTAQVRAAAEIRPGNTTFNQTKGTGPPSNPPASLYNRVTGNFAGTTDEILQWGACKWGIDEDIVRAQAAKESYWDQTAIGDNGESFGLLQVRQPYWGWFFPNAANSTAYNVDAALAARRNCFEGNEGWLNQYPRGRDYAAGDMWGCVGLWFSGRWYDAPANGYITEVKNYLNQRIWETAPFLNYG